MRLLKMELHDPLFSLDEIIETRVDPLYEERVNRYWEHRLFLLEGGAVPSVSEMVWQG